MRLSATPHPGPVQHGRPTVIIGDCCLSIADAWKLLLQLAEAIRQAQSAAVTRADVLARIDREAAADVMEAGDDT